MWTSAALALLIVAYVSWHAFTLPPEPRLSVSVGASFSPEGDGGDVHVEVVVRNEGGAGVRTLGVEVACDDPPVAITFQNIPAQSEFRGTVSCPPGTTAPEVVIAWWIPT